MNLKPRFETSNNILLAGLGRRHKYQDGNANIPAQWDDFVKFLPIKNQILDDAYGVLNFGQTEFGDFEYICAVEVSNYSQTPPELKKLNIKINRYAVFEFNGDFKNLSDAWNFAWNEWLPKSLYSKDEDAQEFEKYIDGTNLNKTPKCELWLPIARKNP